MKKIYILILVTLVLSCNSVKKYNQNISETVSIENLKKDVDITYQKLKNYQPQLYKYISEDKLTYKFDSLKKTIVVPLTPVEFYEKLAPVVSSVRQGHLQIYPPTKKYTKQEIEAQKTKGKSPLSQFKFEIFNNKMYVVENLSGDSTIVKGTEVIAINNNKTSDLLVKFNKLLTSDGFNTTFKEKFTNLRFKSFYGYFYKTNDSLNFQFKNNNNIFEKLITIYKKPKNTSTTKKTTKQEAKSKKEYNSIHGFDAESNEYMRQLTFLDKDSLIAKLHIKGWRNGDFKKFYDQTFALLKKKNTKNLILDLRFNTGGRLDEIFYINKYLSNQNEFVFTDKSEVTTKTSIMHDTYFQGSNIFGYTYKAILAPFYYGYHYLKVKKQNNKFFWSFDSSKPTKVLPNCYKNKVYVLINGASFSASAVLSSSLHGTKRATFVGQETGGDYNGTVAGRMPIDELQNSKIKLRLGLMSVAATQKTNKDGHGVYPDVEITPTIEDRVKNNDPELNWILKDIENTKK